MFLDAQNLFSDAQAVTATAASTNLIDLGAVGNLGVGENLYVVVLVDVAFTDAGSDSTVAVTVETDDSAAFGSATVAMTLGTFAALTAIGSRLIARIQPDAVVERFVRLKYTVAGGNLTTGSLTAFLTKDIQAFSAYPKGYVIS